MASQSLSILSLGRVLSGIFEIISGLPKLKAWTRKALRQHWCASVDLGYVVALDKAVTTGECYPWAGIAVTIEIATEEFYPWLLQLSLLR